MDCKFNRFVILIDNLYFLKLIRCNELQILLDRMKPVNGSIASLYEQAEKHIRPWIKILGDAQDDNVHKPAANISLQKLKQSLEKLLLEHN